MSSMMGKDTATAGGVSAGPKQATAEQSAAVRNGSIGQSGIQGGGQATDYSFLSPQQSANYANGSTMSFSDWLATLGKQGTAQVQKGGGKHGGAEAGLASYSQAPNAQGSHSLSIGSLISAYLGGG